MAGIPSALRIEVDRIINPTTDGLVANASVIAYPSGFGADVEAALTGVLSSYVQSFAGRVGAVLPSSGDYTTTLINNASAAPGASCTDALDNHEGRLVAIEGTIGGLPPTFVESFAGRTGIVLPTVNDYSTSLVSNTSTVAGATCTDALDDHESRIDSVEADVANIIASFVSSFNGRGGAVVSVVGDYAGTEVTNDAPGVPGATVADALADHEVRLLDVESPPYALHEVDSAGTATQGAWVTVDTLAGQITSVGQVTIDLCLSLTCDNVPNNGRNVQARLETFDGTTTITGDPIGASLQEDDDDISIAAFTDLAVTAPVTLEYRLQLFQVGGGGGSTVTANNYKLRFLRVSKTPVAGATRSLP